MIIWCPDLSGTSGIRVNHFLPGLHISWLVIPQTSLVRTAQDMDGRDVSVGSH